MKNTIKKIIYKIRNMFGNDFMMGGPGGAGSSITGKWFNKRTGRTLMVRDSIITGNDMQIICADGSMISMDEFSRDYIQASDELYDEQGNVIGTETSTLDDVVIPKENPTMDISNNNSTVRLVHDNSIGEDLSVETAIEQVSIYKETPKNPDIIEKLFSKIENKPTINIEFNWDDCPSKEIATLVNFLDVDIKDIANYIYDNYVNKDAVSDEITKYLNSIMK